MSVLQKEFVMATRFGATPAHTYATKVRWLVGCLVTLIAVLVIAFVIVAQNPPAVGTEVASAPQPNVAIQSGALEVLVPVSRLEQGVRLEEHLFTGQMIEESKLPMGVIRRRDLPMVVGKYAARLIVPGAPLVTDDISNSPPINLLNIPPGYRAVTITVDATTGVEGWAKPNSRVDVLWTFTQSGKQKVANLVRFTKILSVGGATSSEGARAPVNAQTTVTLLVTEADARKIELARTLGKLTLSLVGSEEPGIDRGGEGNTALSIEDLIGKPAENQAFPQEPTADGVMYSTDPKTGRQVRYVLTRGKWTLDRTFGGEGK